MLRCYDAKDAHARVRMRATPAHPRSVVCRVSLPLLQITGEDAAGGRFMCVALAFHVATPGMGLGPVGAGARAGRGGVAGWGVNRRSDVDMSADFDE